MRAGLLRFSNIIKRGLILALSLGIVVSNLAIPVHAATINDLREFLGLSIQNSSESNPYNGHDKSSSSESGNYSDQNSGESGEDIIYKEIVINNQKLLDLSEYDNQIIEISELLDTRLHNGSSAYVIVNTVDELINITNKRTEAIRNFESGYSKESRVTIIENKDDIYSSYSEEYDVDMEELRKELNPYDLEDISRLDYDIGGIGSNAVSPVFSHMKLITPYGFTKPTLSETYTDSKLLGMDLSTVPNDSIVAQWNGMVVAIGTDDSKSFQYIKLYHGNGLYTVYSHVYVIKGLVVGDLVRAGHEIAHAADTTSYEPSKENHMFYQIKLDGEYINPLLVFGERGKYLYEDWITSYAMDNVVEVGESYFNDKSELKSTHVENPDEYIPPIVDFETLYD